MVHLKIDLCSSCHLKTILQHKLWFTTKKLGIRSRCNASYHPLNILTQVSPHLTSTLALSIMLRPWHVFIEKIQLNLPCSLLVICSRLTPCYLTVKLSFCFFSVLRFCLYGIWNFYAQICWIPIQTKRILFVNICWRCWNCFKSHWIVGKDHRNLLEVDCSSSIYAIVSSLVK